MISFFIHFQSGFGPNHSTEPAVRMLKVWLSSDTGEGSLRVLLHPSAAFDAVGQNIDLNRGETWPLLFCLYMLHVSLIVQNTKVSYHAEDGHVYLNFPQTTWVQPSPRATAESKLTAE